MFYGLQKGKGESKAFPPPSHPYNIVLLFQLPTEDNKDPNCKWSGVGRDVDFCFSVVTLFEFNVSTIILSLIEGIKLTERAYIIFWASISGETIILAQHTRAE